jgi:hypothetical protein
LILISHVKYSVMDWKMVEGAQRPDGNMKGPRTGSRNRESPVEEKDDTLPMPSGASMWNRLSAICAYERMFAIYRK